MKHSYYSEFKSDLISVFLLIGLMLVLGFCAFLLGQFFLGQPFLNWISNKFYDHVRPEAWRAIFISLVVMAAIFILEIIINGWTHSGLRRLFIRPSRTARFDWFFGFIYVLRVGGFFQILFTLGFVVILGKALSVLIAPLVDARLHIHPVTGLGIAAAALAIWWVHTFNDYWWHRLMHTPIFWPLHRVHHTAKEMNIFTQYRGHPGDAIITKFYALVPFSFIDASPEVLVVFTVGGALNGALTHCSIPWGFGLLGRWLVCSPKAHHIHHSTDPDHFNTNFSFLPLWDRLFGTWYIGTKAATSFGVSDDIYEDRSIISGLWFDLKDLYLNFPKRFLELVAIKK